MLYNAFVSEDVEFMGKIKGKMAYDRVSQIKNSFQNQSVYIIGKDARSKTIYVSLYSFVILFPLLRFAPIAGAKNILPIRKKIVTLQPELQDSN